MRVFITLLAIIIVLAWAGFELRPRYRDVSNVLYAFSGIIALVLVAVFFDLI